MTRSAPSFAAAGCAANSVGADRAVGVEPRARPGKPFLSSALFDESQAE